MFLIYLKVFLSFYENKNLKEFLNKLKVYLNLEKYEIFKIYFVDLYNFYIVLLFY